MLIELLIVGVVAVLGFMAGKTWGQYQLIKQMMDCLTPSELEAVRQAVIDEPPSDGGRPNNAEARQLLSSSVVNLLREDTESSVLLYSADDHRFVCQGDTLKSAAARFSEVCPRKIGRIQDDGGGVLYIIGGSVSSDERAAS